MEFLPLRDSESESVGFEETMLRFSPRSVGIQMASLGLLDYIESVSHSYSQDFDCTLMS